MFIYSTGTSNTIGITLQVGGATQATITCNDYDITDYNKYAARWSLNEFSFFINGSEVLPRDVSGSIFPIGTLSQVQFNTGTGGALLYGKTKQVAVYNYLSDTEIQNLTTP